MCKYEYEWVRTPSWCRAIDVLFIQQCTKLSLKFEKKNVTLSAIDTSKKKLPGNWPSKFKLKKYSKISITVSFLRKFQNNRPRENSKLKFIITSVTENFQDWFQTEFLSELVHFFTRISFEKNHHFFVDQEIYIVQKNQFVTLELGKLPIKQPVWQPC